MNSEAAREAPAPLPDLPHARLAAYYFAYFAVIGGYTPYFSVFLHDRGMAPSAIGLTMSLWYAARHGGQGHSRW